MSISSAMNQSYLAQVDAMSRLLEVFLNKREAAPTRADKALVEAEAIDLFERLLELDFNLQALKPGDYPEYDNYQEDYGTFHYLLQVNLAKLRRLTSLFISHFNSQQYALVNLLGKLKRIRQKRAALALWNGEDAKFVLSDRFLNFDWLDHKFTSTENCFVDVAQGVLTLPIRDFTSVSIKSVSVGSGSNGNPGNSDVEITTNNLSPEFTINGDANNWFEYERLDSGPLQLSLIIELAKATVVNNIVIAPLNIGQTYTFVVDDILLSTNGGSYSAKDLAGPVDKERMTVRSAGNDTEWSFTFLPAEAKTIVIKLIQSHPHEIQVARNNGGSSTRKRYALGITKLAVNQITYAASGGINSIERDLPGGLYLTVPVVDIWPAKPELFDAFIEVSFDGGETWISADNVDDSVGDSVLMNGTESTMIWRLQMNRDDNALTNATSFFPDVSPIKKVKHLMKAVNTNKSPQVVALSERPARGEVFVLQPKVGRRGPKSNRIYLGRGPGTTTNFELPFSPVQNGLDPSTLHLYVNGFEYSYVEDNVALAAEQWSFSDDFTEIQCTSHLPDGARVEIVLDEERMLFEERADGYYHQMEMLFDPDEANIDVVYLPRRGSRFTVLLPRDRRVINLGVTNIDTDSFTFTTDGLSWTSVATRTLLASTARSYLLNPEQGILWLSTELDSTTARVSFDHSSATKLQSNKFDVVYGDGTVRPWGIRIAPDAFQSIEETDVVAGTLKKRIDVLTGSFGIRAVGVSSTSNAMSLSHDYIVRGTVRASSDLFVRTHVDSDPQEVNFIDGKTEFYGLVPMNTETTVSTQADVGADTVSFKLAAGALWYQDQEVLFTDTTVFAVDVGVNSVPNATGEYRILGDGTVEVYVGTAGTLTAGIGIHYYYQDPDFEPFNKFSVDYRRGVLYGGSQLRSGATIKYKASSHKVAYNIAREVDRYQYDKSNNAIVVRTEGLNKINALIKIIWAEKTQEKSLRTLRDFFSPIISTLAFRFT